MPQNPNIALSFKNNQAIQEFNNMTNGLKTVKKEFEITNLTIQATGSQIDVLNNKIEGYGKQAEAQRAITAKVRETIEQATAAHRAAAQRVEEARIAYENAKKSQSGTKEELQKLKTELDKANNTYEKVGKQVAQWNDRLLNSQKAEAQLKAAVKNTTVEIDKHNKSLIDNIKNTRNVTTASGQLLNVYTLIKGLAIGYAGKTLFEALIGGNAQFEQYMASFEVLLGGADKAQKRMDELTVFAAKTPFELPQVVEAEKRLLAYGVAAKDTAEVMRILGDISMGNAEKLNMISLAYGQVVTNAKLYGTELRQFAENGVPLLAELASMYGKTESEMRKMIEGGQISAQAVTEALRRMTAEGGKFFEMMEKQSKTAEGLWATLRDNVGMFARDVGEESFRYLKDQLSSFMDALDQMSQSGELSDIATVWGSNIAKFTEFIVEAIKILWNMKEALAVAGIAFAAFKVAMSISNVVMTVTTAIEAYNIAVKEGTAVTAALTAVLNVNPWVLVASVLTAATAALIGYSLISGTTASEAEKLAVKTNKLTEEYERNINAVDRQKNASLGEVNISQRLAKELEGLSAKTNKTTVEKARMSQIVDQLNTNIPNLALAINSETGELNKQIGVVYNAIDAYKQLLFVKASEKKAGVAAEGLIDLQSQKAAIEKEIQSNQKLLDDANQKTFDTMKNNIGKFGFTSQIDSVKNKNETSRIIADRKNLQSQLESVNKAIVDSEKQINDSFEAAKNYAQKYGNSGNQSSNQPYSPPPLLTDNAKDKKAVEKARQEAIQKEFSDLKYARDMEYITEAEYYKRLAALRNKYYKEGSSEYQQYTLEIKQHNDKLKEEETKTEKDKYNDRRANSDRWVAEQKFYDKLSVEQEITAYEAIKKYVKEYYDQGIIDNKEYMTQIRQLNQNEYSARKKALEEEISKNVETQKKILDTKKKAIEDEADADKKRFDARKKAIEDEYAIIDRQEKQAERNAELSDLQRQEALYQNAVTKEGKERLEKIREEIDKLNKEAAKEERDIEKNNRLDALEQEQVQAEENRKKRLEEISQEYANLDETQKSLMENIANYATAAAGTLEVATEKVRALIDAFNQTATTIGNKTGQTINQKNVTINQTNNNQIADPVSATIYGRMINSGFSVFN